MLKRAIQAGSIAVVRPYVYRELPGWGRVYAACVGSYRRNWLWTGSRPRVVLGKLHNYEMLLDLSHWPDRLTFFLGRWYDLGTQLLMSAAVQQGDTVVDVGANRGMFALAAARLVGMSGRVICFEPNPTCTDILERDLQLNSIQNVHILKMGLSDENAELTLRVPHINSGEASFGMSEYSEVDEISVLVRIGDTVLQDTMPTVIKIDVEGYEPRVLKGLTETITRSRPVVISEVIEQHLRRCGCSVDELFGLMGSLGYQGFRVSVKRTGMHFRLHLGDPSVTEGSDIAWLHPQSPVAARLRLATA